MSTTRQTLLDRDAKLSADYEAHQREMSLIAAERNGIAFALNLMQDEVTITGRDGPGEVEIIKPRKPRRTKAQIAADTLAAAKAEGLVPQGAVNQANAAPADPLDLPANLDRRGRA